MEIFYQILNGMSLLIVLFLIIGFIVYLAKNYRNKTILKSVCIKAIWLILLIGIPIYFVNSYYGKRLGQDYRLEHYTTTTYSSNDSLNLEWHFVNVMWFNSFIESERRHVNRPFSSFINEPESQKIISEYEGYIASSDSTLQDIGHLFLSMHFVNMQVSANSVQYHLNAINDTSLKYYNYVQGVNDYNQRDWDFLSSAEAHLKTSIEKEECTRRSFEKLAHVYWYFHKHDQLNDLIDDPQTSPLIPEWMKRARYFKENNWLDYWSVRLNAELSEWHILTASSALILLALWIYFLRKLDIYEPEKKRYLILIFFVSIVSMQLLYPIHDLMWYVFEYHRPSVPVSDLWYCVISIGMVEELVKIIPVLLVLKFTNAINEPFDYILYASISALGFAFIENVGYFSETIQNVPGRGIYCCIIHMAFSATIGYGLMLAKYRGYNKYLMFTLFFLIASFLHGFYDFWIMDWWASEYSWMSSVIFILCIHLWFLYINNTLNCTVFYDRKIRLKTDNLKYVLLMVSIGILMTGYIATSIVYSTEFANEFLKHKAYYLSFFILYLMISSGSMKIVRGYLSPVSIPILGLLIRNNKLKDLSGHHLELSKNKKFGIIDDLIKDKNLLNQQIELQERIIVDDKVNGYVFKLSQELDNDEFESTILIGIPHWDISSFNDRKRILTNLFLIDKTEVLDQPFIKEEHLTYLGKVFSRKLT